MNLVDVEVVEIIMKPYLKSNGDWETVVKVGSWGSYWSETIFGTEEFVNKYKIGYKLLE